MWWRAGSDGVSVRVRVQPRARRAGLLGVVPGADGPCLKLAVTEPPEDGRANRAACTVLARVLGVPPSAVAVAQGSTVREKVLAVAGDPGALAASLERLA